MNVSEDIIKNGIPQTLLPPHELLVDTFIPKHPLEGVEIPDTWEDLNAFAEWYCNNGMPFVPPEDYEVYRSDDATSICMFRHGRFQVELYLIFPNPNLPVHEHPGVEVIKWRPFCPHVREDMCRTSPVLRAGQSHGAGINFKETTGLEQGFPLFAFQKWDEGLQMTTVAARWRGKTVGPRQEHLVKRFNPDAFVVDGFVDVTLKSKK